MFDFLLSLRHGGCSCQELHPFPPPFSSAQKSALQISQEVRDGKQPGENLAAVSECGTPKIFAELDPCLVWDLRQKSYQSPQMWENIR